MRPPGLNTTGKRSGVEIRAIRSPKPGRPSVTWKKNRRAARGPGSLWRRSRRWPPCAAGSDADPPARQGRLAVDERRKHTHLPDVVALRLLAETADGHVLEHPLAKQAGRSLALLWSSMGLSRSEKPHMIVCPGVRPQPPPIGQLLPQAASSIGRFRTLDEARSAGPSRQKRALAHARSQTFAEAGIVHACSG